MTQIRTPVGEGGFARRNERSVTLRARMYVCVGENAYRGMTKRNTHPHTCIHAHRWSRADCWCSSINTPRWWKRDERRKLKSRQREGGIVEAMDTARAGLLPHICRAAVQKFARPCSGSPR